MSNFIRICSNNDFHLAQELQREIGESGVSFKKIDNIIPGASEVIVTLGSAGAFTALYKVLSKVLNVNKNRQITIQHKESSISITGHSLMEEEALIKMIAPHLLDDKKTNSEKK
jgi:hypothetical protein